MANKKVQFTLTAIDKTKAAFDRVGKGLKMVGGGAKMFAVCGSKDFENENYKKRATKLLVM